MSVSQETHRKHKRSDCFSGQLSPAAMEMELDDPPSSDSLVAKKLKQQQDSLTSDHELPAGVVSMDSVKPDPSSSEDKATEASTLPGKNVKMSGASSSKVESSPKAKKEEEMDDVLRKLMYFKQFDTVADCSDHYYLDMKNTSRQPSKSWAKKIQDEWKILEQNLPETIYVRVYESRMDLLRAVIIGPAGTPYHDGLFVFDAVFPPSYPSDPPKMMYTLRNPPQHFEDLVAGHFRIHAYDILTACKAYTEGAEVGCSIKKWLEEGENAGRPGSTNFRQEVAKMMKPLLKYFLNNGSKDCDKFQTDA
ncbi:hypothetical protein Cgig2_005921 [Carnegiea gigantea]|uniref:UBC core domain-containing protein n=1 Tax=Carnegiea gigantea TaxID=171969 RepID=A0A9Q1JVW4_9CARY|nr:hypothetical protein Cgig2_005921 [Carnegiea gigantea]